MTDDRPAARRRRLRRAGARAVAAQAHAVAARVRRRRVASRSVGANQLANVRWSAVFDDVELTAADIARLAEGGPPARPLRRPWVALDQADLEAAAEALAERANTTQLTGAEMLRHALGLEGSPLAGGITVEGGGWAADLLAPASERLDASRPPRPRASSASCAATRPRRSAWLGFLDAAGLGGCLALDMGLGKTPTMLAHLLAHRRRRARRW